MQVFENVLEELVAVVEIARATNYSIMFFHPKKKDRLKY